MGYLIDTNPIIYYFNGLADDEALHEMLADSFKVSIITKIEFLGWLSDALVGMMHDAMVEAAAYCLRMH